MYTFLKGALTNPAPLQSWEADPEASAVAVHRLFSISISQGQVCLSGKHWQHL